MSAVVCYSVQFLCVLRVGVTIESIQSVQDPAVTIVFNLKLSQQCKNAAGKTNRMLGLINRNFLFIYEGIILPIHNSLFRPHLDYAVQFCRPAIHRT